MTAGKMKTPMTVEELIALNRQRAAQAGKSYVTFVDPEVAARLMSHSVPLQKPVAVDTVVKPESTSDTINNNNNIDSSSAAANNLAPLSGHSRTFRTYSKKNRHVLPPALPASHHHHQSTQQTDGVSDADCLVDSPGCIKDLNLKPVDMSSVKREFICSSF
jgi:hypothetical protein